MTDHHEQRIDPRSPVLPGTIAAAALATFLQVVNKDEASILALALVSVALVFSSTAYVLLQSVREWGRHALIAATISTLRDPIERVAQVFSGLGFSALILSLAALLDQQHPLLSGGFMLLYMAALVVIVFSYRAYIRTSLTAVEKDIEERFGSVSSLALEVASIKDSSTELTDQDAARLAEAEQTINAMYKDLVDEWSDLQELKLTIPTWIRGGSRSSSDDR